MRFLVLTKKDTMFNKRKFTAAGAIVALAASFTLLSPMSPAYAAGVILAPGATVADLQDAINNASSGDTITIGGNMDIDFGVAVNGHNVVLDLGGFTLNDTASYSFTVSGGGSLTMKNGTVSGSAYIIFFIDGNSGGGTVELISGMYTTTSDFAVYARGTSGSTATNVSTLTIDKDATLEATSPDGVGLFVAQASGSVSYGMVVNISGTLSGGDPDGAAIFVSGNIQTPADNEPIFNIHSPAAIKQGIAGNGYAIWNIDGGTITGSPALSALELGAGKLKMSGGTLVGVGPATCMPTDPRGSTNTSGYGLAIVSKPGYAGHIDIEVTGGDFKYDAGGTAIGAVIPDGAPADPVSDPGKYVPTIKVAPAVTAKGILVTSDDPNWNVFTVTFYVQGSTGAVPPEQYVYFYGTGDPKNNQAGKVTPTWPGHVFTGWYTDAASAAAGDAAALYDFSSDVPTDLVLFAGWTKAPAPKPCTDHCTDTGGSVVTGTALPYVLVGVLLLCAAGVGFVVRRRWIASR